MLGRKEFRQWSFHFEHFIFCVVRYSLVLTLTLRFKFSLNIQNKVFYYVTKVMSSWDKNN
ncbi:hypothetical protein PARMER_02618 [Parabacteroides merdae ATCC 43184]|nr:hypothetical protein PARMER_02618 [Parabacteroides merdae ATCC 43184]